MTIRLSEKIAKYTVNLHFSEIPEEVVKFTKLCIVDYYASLLKGKEAAPVAMMHEVIKALGGEPQATEVTGLKTSVTNAAFVNGGASHVIELDDIHKASIVHAATVIMPAALAVAEWQGASGQELIEAIVAGYEIAFRVGETVTPSHYFYFHNTATCGTFGAAIAVAKLLKLSEEEIVEAIGSAGTQAAGLWEFIEDGAMSKQLHPGKAAMNGILSAMLAAQGFTGAKHILEGKRGFFEAMSEEYDVSKMTNGLGTQFKILENSFKIHASCRHTHAAMDLAIELSKKVQEKGIHAIQSIHIGAYKVALDITDDAAPQTIYAAKFSMQFCVTLALLTGAGGFNSFNEQTLLDDNICAVMERLDVSIDDEINVKYPLEWGAKLTVTWTDGTTDKLKAAFPKGDPENPITAQDFIDKFNDLVPLAEAHKKAITDALLALDTIDIESLIRIIYDPILIG